MSFVFWHYTKGLCFYFSWLEWQFAKVTHFFSPLLLLKTFFAPWKRMLVENKGGFNFSRWFENLMFNFISRWVGATVKFFLLFGYLICLVFIFVFGIVGFFVWLLLPLVGLPVFWKENRNGNFLTVLSEKLKAFPEKAPDHIFSSKIGQFIVFSTSLDIEKLKNLSFKPERVDNFSDAESIISWFLASSPFVDDVLKDQGLSRDDLLLAARWWDEREKNNMAKQERVFGQPGIGLRLLFGYTPTLDQCSSDLSLPKSFTHRLIGRQKIVSRIERTLSSGNSVFLTGLPGVGKKTVVLEFAKKAANGSLGKQMAYRRILELDYNFIFSEAVDINQKKTKLKKILTEASRAGNIILVVGDIHRITNPDVEGFDFTDVLESFLEKGEPKIIALSTTADYERFLAPDSRLAKSFSPVEVVAPTKEEAMIILLEATEKWQKKEGILVSIPVVRQIVEKSDQYVTDIPFPEKALEVLEEVVVYRSQNGGGKVTLDDVNTVLAEKTGVSFAKLTESEKVRLENLEEIIHQKLINQNAAVSLIAKSLRSRTLGVKDDKKPVGSFLFLGPTGVGKTQTAKVLAQAYYGSEKEIIRFDMAEFSGLEGMARLIGSASQNKQGSLTTAIKNKPASLLLLDEIEKSSPEIFNLFLVLLDEGVITDARDKKVSCRHLFVIATSNAGGEYIRQLVGRGVKGEELQKAVVDYIQKERIFTPEFLNRFDGVVVFEPLTEQNLIEIARLLVGDLAKKLTEKQIVLKITEDLCQKLAQQGFDPALGARPMRRIIDLTLGDLAGRAILKGEIGKGDTIVIVPGEGKDEYKIEKLTSQ
jgi:ATP-dependent Clp protease ATP-binding subunit ClpC